MFFVATAPLAIDDRINLSPKGYGALRIFGPNEVGYLDLTGSGNETAAHLLENGRITILFCSFEEAPLLVRLYGRGHIVLPDDENWPSCMVHFEHQPGIRQIILVNIDSVAESCGYMTPIIERRRVRTDLTDWARELGPEALEAYREETNIVSIDGLPTGQARPNPDF